MYLYNFLEPQYPTSATAGDTDRARKVYATALWHVVKTWEVMQEFGLEDHQQQLFPSVARRRAAGSATRSSTPRRTCSSWRRNNTGINDNGRHMFTYFSMAWYQVWRSSSTTATTRTERTATDSARWTGATRTASSRTCARQMARAEQRAARGVAGQGHADHGQHAGAQRALERGLEARGPPPT